MQSIVQYLLLLYLSEENFSYCNTYIQMKKHIQYDISFFEKFSLARKSSRSSYYGATCSLIGSALGHTVQYFN